MSAKQEFVDKTKEGKVLVKKCTKCGHLHLSTVYFCQNCGARGFENEVLDGKGSVITYTIITVPPAGFERYAPYAWVVLDLDNSELHISGFLPNIAEPADLPVGSKVKITDFDDRGIILEKL
ncbi:MAG: nucleotide-binding protein [Nitrosopumilaceae archaeon]|nr:nucleotide-binding protein [Nitrosopumilaceae archaeon]NIT99912.1 nucleotide-binding protein [Nitrosopumilaceae archaeon]NIU86266.1 nucleotide-binding protein [Nitrosopumilaceae archaeon]NIV65021.1 nucleotide-binding protein [Nitrosopumilaceae archaeon]NIX60515.1 nucleotide-binding protein [Nitrosopumilaceae archaeon]